MRLRNRGWMMVVFGALIAAMTGSAEAGRRHGYVPCADDFCEPCGTPDCGQTICEPQVVERTIMVPQMTTEKRVIQVTKYRCEQRPEVVTCTRLVPQVYSYKKTVTDMVSVKRTRVVDCMVTKPVTREEAYEVVVRVPHVEKREGTRMVTRYVPDVEKRVVCEDQGRFEERVVEVATTCDIGCDSAPCGRRGKMRRRGCVDFISCDVGCGADKGCVEKTCQVTHKVWVPNIVERTIEVPVQRAECVPEKYTYDVVVCRPEKRVCKRMVTDYIQVPSKRTVAYYECVPKTREIVCHETRCKPVTEQRTIMRTVRIPYVVDQEICVPVCHMVEKKILCTVPAPCAPACKKCR